LTATNWEIEFEFKISGAGTLYGDGMALWVTKERATSGPVFGSVNKFDGLGGDSTRTEKGICIMQKQA